MELGFGLGIGLGVGVGVGGLRAHLSEGGHFLGRGRRAVVGAVDGKQHRVELGRLERTWLGLGLGLGLGLVGLLVVAQQLRLRRLRLCY